MKSFSILEVLVLVLVFLALKVKGEVYLVTFAKQRIIGKGQNLQINCTVFGEVSGSNFELKWKKNGNLRDIKSQKVANNTLQLQIQSVRKSDEGKYQCEVTRQDQLQNSTFVHVIVGDLPIKPSTPNWRSIDWQICFNWKPVSIEGGLPVRYKIQYRCLSQCDLDDDVNLLSNGWHEACKNTSATPGREMKCCLDHVTLFIVYEAVVVAENALGSVTSSPVNFSRGIETIIGPPQSLRAQAIGYGSITIDWTPPPNSFFWQMKYAILYHAQGDSTNKTIILDSNRQNHYRLTNLQPYTSYTVYVAGIDPMNGRVGIPVEPVAVLTNEENPSDAPEITDWDSIVYPENFNKRNVTVTWKLPPKAKWNGKIQTFIIQYREISSKRIDIMSNVPWGKSVKINSSSTNKGMISNLHTKSAYEVEMQMCNGAGCGGIGTRVVIKGLKTSHLEEKQKVFGDHLIILVLILLTAIVFFFAVTVLLVCFRMKRIKQTDGEEAPAKCYPLKKTSYDRMNGEIIT